MLRPICMAFVALVGIFVSPGLVLGETNLVGKVVSVQDGDTLTILDDESRQHRIRVSGIDAPEKDQPYGAVSTAHVMELVYGKLVTAECEKVDRYGREVCTIRVDDVDVGLAQLRAGLAWHYKKYASEQSPKQRQAYAEAEKVAKEKALGLWLLSTPTPPWDWRHRKLSTDTPIEQGTKQ